MIYPWLTDSWQQISDHWTQQPSAWLLHGHSGIGKRAFAEHLVQALLCENNQTQTLPCGQCTSCHLFAQHSHPDFFVLTPPAADGDSTNRKRPQIKVAEVRAVLDFAHLSSHRGGRRVVLVNPAESMNPQAANALLKVLEEPPAQVIFILVSNHKDRLLPTIRSRCRALALPMPTRAEALAYLQAQQQNDAADLLAFHGGAPLFDPDETLLPLRHDLLTLLAQPRLLALLDYAIAFDKQKQPLAVLLDWLYKWLADVACAQQGMAVHYYPAHQSAIAAVAQRSRAIPLFALIDRLTTLAPYGMHTLNVKMQVEDLLIDYLRFWQNKT